MRIWVAFAGTDRVCGSRVSCCDRLPLTQDISTRRGLRSGKEAWSESRNVLVSSEVLEFRVNDLVQVFSVREVSAGHVRPRSPSSQPSSSGKATSIGHVPGTLRDRWRGKGRGLLGLAHL
ncbi:hypothetical protein E2C01_056041 [Portunus trituberculatus]|uniref:Uncharacterized protein n=1 Tax=Portunus trituberculatus TaxID=210409 RepID=A0A5B7GT10_PORTR|nr:hypothetical protein [Portunus trituberculatus]